MRVDLSHDGFYARQGVEDDMNVFCFGGKVVVDGLSLALFEIFLATRFTGAPRINAA